MPAFAHSSSLPTRLFPRALTLAGALLCGTALVPNVEAQTSAETAAGTNRALELSDDSPFRDPDVVYLEADELLQDDAAKTLTAVGEVEGRYQDRTIRADRVIYNTETGEIFAEGHVTIVDPTGASQFAEKVNLSNELQAGTATNFTLRTADGGLTRAALAQRNDDGSIDLFNAYYTACKTCAEDPDPTWRIKAKQVSQRTEQRSVLYRDAVFEFLGVPVLYTPFLAHPDPSADRATGFLTPLAGFTGDKGVFARVPYFVAVDDSTNVTATTRVFSRVNPVLDVLFEKQFATGRLNWNSSLTYASVFDNDGNAFRDPEVFLDPGTAPTGRRLRSHTFADGRFNPSDNWTYGFGVELASDPLYLERYDFDQFPDTRGLFSSDSLRLINQAYVVGQGDDYRVSVAAVGFQSQRAIINELDDGRFLFAEENNDILPRIAPRIDAVKTFDIAGTRLDAFGNGVFLTRRDGVDYGRASVGLDWSDTHVVGPGVEVKGFAFGRLDTFDIDPNVELPDGTDAGLDQDRVFSRALGHVGVDVRYPFVRPGKVDWIVEPRVQATHSVGDGRAEEFQAVDAFGEPISLFQDSLAIDLDPSLLWEANKSTGFDFWQEGTRVDAGASVAARWDDNEVRLFAGQSWADGFDDDFDVTSGLSGSSSDVVGSVEARFGTAVRTRTRLRYDDGDNVLRRIDSELFVNVENLQMNARYFRSEGATPEQAFNPTAPTEEVSGSVLWKFADEWSTSYGAVFDMDESVLRRQDVGLIFNDDCTRVELLYTRDNVLNGVVGNQSGFAIRVSLATLGSVN